MPLYYLPVHLVCAVLAYYLFKHSWRKSFNFKKDDQLFFLSLSLVGPVSLVVAATVWTGSLLTWPNGDTIISKKYTS